jgi:hypothetical protein
LQEHLKVFQFYASTLRELLQSVRAGKASLGLIRRFCYLARLDAVDPDAAGREWDDFLQHLPRTMASAA